ncbi:LOW QUALITY PROTEIN: hypothetical protein DAPPUDRAFT_266418 [Daphnia pulex]|uniref:DUF6570 domain-containing protein n=1 Tax=Daphnia pulex TaxID=6669 RepID=E9HV04_DAPPU|nr:LOW QUALITY PROTEIN: hypothetical protein DAPPUDRAFT_266418 [Daphnia pulex]|eukprot:EFX64428.1 LOW QUALITY PROTEIN: hypothetical protein DAPPUDRAFT_266418 [Daphnia pulex]
MKKEYQRRYLAKTTGKLDPNAPRPTIISNIINEVNQNVTEDDMSRIVEEFLQSWNIEAKLFACASCGMKAFEMGADQAYSVPIDQLSSLLMSDTDMEELLSIPLKFRPMLLPTAEEYVIATARLFILIIKLSDYQHGERQSGKLGHAIVFPLYHPQLETEIRKARVQRHTGTFPCLDNIYDTISIAFVGSDLQWAAMAVNKSHRAFKPIRVRSAVIYMWLAALKACN